ncbi:lipid-A-disaccharide synthase [bacterium A37T11]|nr:lipid-A-disaccharide synthase [bacterium A37T11]
MDYYLIAGETSGDLHGANLIRALKQADNRARFRIVGGDRMQQESGEQAVLHTSKMAFMGFVEVVANLRTIFRNLKQVKDDLLANRPHALILIDFPGFNLSVADFAKDEHIPVFYYISPKVWAWNQRRVLRIKRVVDHLFCILPFEVDFYNTWGMQVDYVGNPLMDAVSGYTYNPEFLKEQGLEGKPILALLPGSRKMEISKLLPEMARLARMFPGHHTVIAGAPNFTAKDYQKYLRGEHIPIVFNATYDLLKHASAAVVASGTATLETALLNVPQVVVYKANAMSIAIARLLIKIRFISLVNLIMDTAVVKELIQKECTTDTIADEIDLLLNDKTYRINMLQQYEELAVRVGGPGASERTAAYIISYLKSGK